MGGTQCQKQPSTKQATCASIKATSHFRLRNGSNGESTRIEDLACQARLEAGPPAWCRLGSALASSSGCPRSWAVEGKSPPVSGLGALRLFSMNWGPQFIEKSR